VDQRTPWRPVAQQRDLAEGVRAGDEVVQDEVEPQAVAHPASGGEAQARDGEGVVRQLGEAFLGA